MESVRHGNESQHFHINTRRGHTLGDGSGLGTSVNNEVLTKLRGDISLAQRSGKAPTLDDRLNLIAAP